jgi:DNA repair protein RadC
VRYQRVESPQKLDGPEAARDFFSGCFADQDSGRESLWVAHLDEEARCVQLTRHEGDRTGIEFPLRKIIVDAARNNSAAILLAHNHPSGDPTPSQSDMRATRELATAARALGCEIADHLVFGSGDCTSLRALGYL